MLVLYVCVYTTVVVLLRNLYISKKDQNILNIESFAKVGLFYSDELCNGDDSCCTPTNRCGIFEGDCDDDEDCLGGLVCGSNNCKGMGLFDDCCALKDEDEEELEELGLTPAYERAKNVFESLK